MKKVTVAIALLMTLVLLTACSNTTQTVSQKAYWEADINSDEVTRNIYERSTYEMNFVTSTASTFDGTISYDKGSYVTTLSAENYNGVYVYAYETKLLISGEITSGGKTVNFDDVTTTKVLFRSLRNKFSPISSYKYVKNTFVYETGKPAETYEYEINTSYQDKTATVKYSPLNEYAKAQSTEKSTEFKNYNNSLYFDNEQVPFIGRAFALADGFSASFSSIDTTAMQQNNLTISTRSSDSVTSLVLDSYAYNGEDKGSVAMTVVKANIAISSSQMSGYAFTAYYCKTEELNENRNRLLRYETPYPSNAGTMIYVLKAVDTIVD